VAHMAAHATRVTAPVGHPFPTSSSSGGSTTAVRGYRANLTVGRTVQTRRANDARVSSNLKQVPASEQHAERTSGDDRTRVRAFLERLFHSDLQTPYSQGDSEWAALGLYPSPPPGNSWSLEESCDTFQVKLEERPSSSSSESNGGPGNSGPENGSKGNDYYANVGYAIRTLREDIPLLFIRDLNYDIYREDIVFKDPRNTFKGMDNYKLIFWSLRFHGRIFFRTVFVEIKRLWQIDDNCIRMRWTVHGFPRVPWEAEGTFDGVSEFKLDKDGKIYSHSVDNVIFRDPPGERLPLFALPNLTPARNQQPVPGGWCLDEDSQKLLPRFSWIRLYLAAALLPSLRSPNPDPAP